MVAEKEWLLFLESNPELWQLSKSKILMLVLERLCFEALTLNNLYLHFPALGLKQLEEILELMAGLRLVSKSIVSGNTVFRATPKAIKAVEMYKKAEKQFGL